MEMKTSREGLDRKAGRGRGARALRPTLRWGDIEGVGPNAASSGNLALSPQAARNNAIDPAMRPLAATFRRSLAHRSLVSTAGPWQVPGPGICPIVKPRRCVDCGRDHDLP